MQRWYKCRARLSEKSVAQAGVSRSVLTLFDRETTMRPYARSDEKKILNERLKDFMGEVIPVDLLPYLPCLQQTDKEAIEATQNNKGPTTANQTLVDRLKRRDKGFSQFVRALRQTGNEHTALLVDPYYLYPIDEGGDEAAVLDGSGIGYKRIGTAIDVIIKGNLSSETNGDEEEPESCSADEEYLADLYKEHSSKQSKQMRKELQRYLPQGAVFVHTAKGSIITTIRLSTKEAAMKLWDMYTEGEFQKSLQHVLVDDTFKKHEKIPEKPLKLNLSICRERFVQIQNKLAEIEEEQEREEKMRSTLSSKPEDSAADDDGSVSEVEEEIDIPPVYLGTKANPFNVCELELREYQKELAAPALEGKNTIICAPTNSGKTYVAIEIAKNHLESFKAEAPTESSRGKGPKVVFIVSTVNLVSQQKERFELYLRDKYSVVDISGANATEIPLKYLLQSHDIIVLTAQILVNALNCKTKEEQVNLEDISLLLFDECHHAHKEHSYNRIMETYLALKKQPRKQGPLPQVVGFTASLGTGKAKSVEKAEEHILLVSANLDAEVISTVKKNKSELKKFANVPERNVHQVLTTGNDPFEKIISQVMKRIEAKVKGRKGEESTSVPPDDNKACQQYRQWVEELSKSAVADADRYLITFADHLREYHIALTINKSTTLKNAKKRLEKYFKFLDREKFLPIDKNLERLFQCAMELLEKNVAEHGEPENPFLMKLKELLLQHYKDVSPQKHEKVDQPSNGKADSENDTAKKCTDGCIEGESLEAGASSYDSEKRREEDANSGKDDKANGGNPEEHAKVVTAQVYSTHNGEERGENENGNEESAKKALGACSIDANDPIDHQENNKGESGITWGHKKPNQEDEKLAEHTPDDESSDKSSGERKDWIGPKGILFTRTRESTSALEDWIKEDQQLRAVLRPEALVGSGDGHIGMTQNEQERVLSRFHTGEKNLLLATSVAEEGLDIRDCNFVIRYDMMGNEISSVQSRGRVRADEGMYSVLVSVDSGALKRENTNRFRETLMVEALSKVQNISTNDFQRKVKAIQDKNFRDRKLKKGVMASKKSNPVPDDVTLHCRKCNEAVCQAHDIRRVRETFYVIIRSDVRESKVLLKSYPNPKKIDDVEFNKKIYCKKCGQDWGVSVRISEVEWLCIKICSFVVQFPGPNPQRMMKKKWKDLPFGVEEATFEELWQQAEHEEQDCIEDDLSDLLD